MRRKTEVRKPVSVGETVHHAFFKEWGPGKVRQVTGGRGQVLFRDQDRTRNPGPVWVPLDHLRHPRKKP